MTLIAVSKTQPAEAIEPLLRSGASISAKIAYRKRRTNGPRCASSYPEIRLHLVGQLQSNKAEDAVHLFDCIHSLDRPSLVKALAKAFDKTGRRAALLRPGQYR